MKWYTITLPENWQNDNTIIHFEFETDGYYVPILMPNIDIKFLSESPIVEEFGIENLKIDLLFNSDLTTDTFIEFNNKVRYDVYRELLVGVNRPIIDQDIFILGYHKDPNNYPSSDCNKLSEFLNRKFYTTALSLKNKDLIQFKSVLCDLINFGIQFKQYIECEKYTQGDLIYKLPETTLDIYYSIERVNIKNAKVTMEDIEKCKQVWKQISI